MAPQLSPQQRQLIVVLREAGYRIKEIERRTGITRTSINFWLKRYKETGGDLTAHHRQNYKRATTDEQDAAILAAHNSEPTLNTRVTATQYNVSTQTIRRRLKANGMKLVNPNKKKKNATAHDDVKADSKDRSDVPPPGNTKAVNKIKESRSRSMLKHRGRIPTKKKNPADKQTQSNNLITAECNETSSSTSDDPLASISTESGVLPTQCLSKTDDVSQSTSDSTAIDASSAKGQFGCCCCREPIEASDSPLYSHTADPHFSLYDEMLRDCFHITLSEAERESALICEACIGRLRDAVSFKQQVMQSQSFMQNCPSLVKQEKVGADSDTCEQSHTVVVHIEAVDDAQQTAGDGNFEVYTHRKQATEQSEPNKIQQVKLEPVDIDMDVQGEVGTETTEDEHFFRDGCGCPLHCCEQFPRDEIIAFRSECRKLDMYCSADINHLDLFIMGAFPTNVGHTTTRFKDILVCKNFFIYVYGITAKRYDDFLRRVGEAISETCDTLLNEAIKTEDDQMREEIDLVDMFPE